MVNSWNMSTTQLPTLSIQIKTLTAAAVKLLLVTGDTYETQRVAERFVYCKQYYEGMKIQLYKP